MTEPVLWTKKQVRRCIKDHCHIYNESDADAKREAAFLENQISVVCRCGVADDGKTLLYNADLVANALKDYFWDRKPVHYNKEE